MPMPAPVAHGQHHFQAAPDDYVQHPQVPATAVHHQQIQGQTSPYGFHHQMPMPAPVPHGLQAPPSDYVQHPQVPATAVHHQQIQGQASLYGFRDHMPMPAPVAYGGQHDIPAAPADYVQHPPVLVTAVQHQEIIGEASAYGFQHQMPTPPSGTEEDIFSLSSPDSSEMVREYMMQNGDYDIAVDFVGDQAVNHAGGSAATQLNEDEKDFVLLWPGRLHCDYCHVVRKIRFQSGKHMHTLHDVYICHFRKSTRILKY
jgi:hypothetical protein